MPFAKDHRNARKEMFCSMQIEISEEHSSGNLHKKNLFLRKRGADLIASLSLISERDFRKGEILWRQLRRLLRGLSRRVSGFGKCKVNSL